MAEGRGRAEWQQTGAILAMIVNVKRDPRKSRPFTPNDFNPFAVNPKPVTAVERSEGFAMLRQAFCRKGSGR